VKAQRNAAAAAAAPFSPLSRRTFAALGLTLMGTSRSRAQDQSSRPIRILVGTTPGGSIDAGARLIAAKLSEVLGTTVIVENKPGAAGIICSEYVAKSPPDGYTLLVGTPSPIIVAPQVMPAVTFNPLKDLAAINIVSTSPLAIAVNPNIGVNTIQDLVALTRKRPVTMGLPLAGSVSHLVVEMTAKVTGCNFLNVPYRGATPALNDAVAGHVDATVSDVGVFLQMHTAGKLRIVLVTSAQRIPALPDVTAAGEISQELIATNWIGVFAPARTPRPVLEKLSEALVRIAAREDTRAQFLRSSVTAATMPGPEAFQAFVATEYARYGQLVRERGIVITE
jgi:tripartite-type tricarboxylate transporter receptor subunit TctC